MLTIPPHSSADFDTTKFAANGIKPLHCFWCDDVSNGDVYKISSSQWSNIDSANAIIKVQTVKRKYSVVVAAEPASVNADEDEDVVDAESRVFPQDDVIMNEYVGE